MMTTSWQQKICNLKSYNKEYPRLYIKQDQHCGAITIENPWHLIVEVKAR